MNNNNSIQELSNLIELLMHVNIQNNLNIRLCLGQELQNLYGENQKYDLICSKCKDTLSGLFSKETVICAHCKSVRQDSNDWIQIESIIRNHTGLCFSHGLCPNCYNLYNSF